MAAIEEDLNPLPGLEQISIRDAVQLLKQKWGDLADNLLPLEHLGNGYLACAFINRYASDVNVSRVVLWHAFLPLHEQPFITLADDVESYRIRRHAEPDRIADALFAAYSHQNFASDWQTSSLSLFRHTVEEFHARPDAHSHRKRGTLPRYDSWKPVRHCVHDYVLGLASYRHDRKQNLLQVNSFITSDHDNFEAGSGTRALLELLLSEAFRAGGSLAIQFIPPNSGHSPDIPAIPPDVRVFTALAGIDLPHEAEHLDPNTVRGLFLFLSGLAEEGRRILLALDAEGRISIEQICYIALSGIWPAADLSSLLLWCPNPELLSSPGIELHRRGAMGGILSHTRAVLLASWAQAKIETILEMAALSMSADLLNPMSCLFPHVRVLRPSDSIELPCEDSSFVIRRGDSVALIPVGVPHVHLIKGVEQAVRMTQGVNDKRALILPADYRQLNDSEQRSVTSITRESDVRILVCENDLTSLDLETISRINKARVLRQ